MWLLCASQPSTDSPCWTSRGFGCQKSQCTAKMWPSCWQDAKQISAICSLMLAMKICWNPNRGISGNSQTQSDTACELFDSEDPWSSTTWCCRLKADCWRRSWTRSTLKWASCKAGTAWRSCSPTPSAKHWSGGVALRPCSTGSLSSRLCCARFLSRSPRSCRNSRSRQCSSTNRRRQGRLRGTSPPSTKMKSSCSLTTFFYGRCFVENTDAHFPGWLNSKLIKFLIIQWSYVVFFSFVGNIAN